VPQDIPFEAGETLAYTPPALADLDAPPVFYVRYPTTREKRWVRLQHIEEGLRRHPPEEVRKEILAGLKLLWDEEVYARHTPILKAYWEAQDDFAKQLPDLQAEAVAAKQDPSAIRFEYDPDIVAACDKLVSNVLEAHRPLRKMMAQNADFDLMHPVVLVASALERWKNLKTPRKSEGGFVTVESVDALKDELAEIERGAGIEEGRSFGQIYTLVSMRTYLGEEAAKNFVSPSLSGTTPAASKASPEKAGKSPASTARSAKTPESA